MPVLRKALPPGRRLIEPFAGSGSVFLGTRYESYLLNDANPDLINLFRWVQRDLDRFLRSARPLFPGKHPDAETYLRNRDAFNACERDTLERAVLFLWLNKTCFNGICRYNSAGQFNVPRGRYKGDLVLPEESLRAFHMKARIATFKVGDFQAVMAEAKEGDVVYCDPPYAPRSQTASFTKYFQTDFGLDRHLELAEACKAAVARGATVVVSNSDTSCTRIIFQGAMMVSARLPHLVGAHGRSRKHVGEALFLFGDPAGLEFWSMGQPAEARPAPDRKVQESEIHDTMTLGL